MSEINTNPIKLSPSDLTFLWDECKRCFYLKYVHGINRPAAPFPAIFGTIDKLMKDYFQDRQSADLYAALPAGRVRFGERWVESLPVVISGHTRQCYLKGKFDTIIAFEDGSYGVVDFKTTEPRPQHAQFYARQLHAYTYALEHAAAGQFSLFPVSKLGLLIVSPRTMEINASGQIAYLGSMTWMEVPRDDAAFESFLGEVLGELELPEPPAAGEKCVYCQYRQKSRQHNW